MTDQVYTFDRFEPGVAIGRRDYVLTQEDCDKWFALFPEDRMGNTMPPGMMASVTMQAYASILAKKPPGNVHGAQRFDLRRLPRIGDTLTTELRCTDKSIRSDRKWLTLEMNTTDSSGTLMWAARLTVLWAA
jgi:hypothetical protein